VSTRTWPERIADLERLMEAATPGPWAATKHGHVITVSGGGVVTMDGAGKNDVACIIAMRSALPALLARLRALEAVAEAARPFRICPPSDDYNDCTWTEDERFYLTPRGHAERALLNALTALDASKETAK
jgi:hypothetical protein